jgi:ribosomal 50S subunit-associated protein YjgA (DUF615 family)
MPVLIQWRDGVHADNKPPTRYKHLFQNLKKAQLEDGAR